VLHKETQSVSLKHRENDENDHRALTDFVSGELGPSRWLDFTRDIRKYACIK